MEGEDLLKKLRMVYATALDSPDTKVPNAYNDSPDPLHWKPPFSLQDPENIETKVEYDLATGKYLIYKKVGNEYFKYPKALTLEEYRAYEMERSMQEFWRAKDDLSNAGNNKVTRAEKKPLIEVKGESFDKLFGGNTIEIKPQGSAELTFGVNRSRTDNPALAERQRKISTFNFDQKIQLNLVGNIGEKLKIQTNYNTEATFDFENQLKLDYTGFEDEIIKKIEVGNVSFPVNNSLITGSQSLFGIKAQMQFGRLTTTTVFSQQKGQKSEIETQGGAQTSTFDFKADDYEANKHYFLSQFFRSQYDRAMATLPNPSSGINITRIEVWVTNVNNSIDNTRNIVALADLGEDPSFGTPGPPITDLLPGDVFPQNGANNLFRDFVNDPEIVGFDGSAVRLQNLGYQAATHFEKVESARRLEESSYTINARLGFISLNSQPLNNDEVLAVAYEYTFGGQTYQVGQLSTDGVQPPNALLLKLLKPTITNPRNPIWDLMMKNVYSINAFQVNKEDFILDVFYNDPALGVDINYIPQGGLAKIPLIRVLGLDRLDPQDNANPDGIFDFVDGAMEDGGTINARNGRIFFPTVEPFGENLRQRMVEDGIPTATIDSIVFQPLYDSTKIAAKQMPNLNRFTMRGSYKSASGSEISLNALNIPEGSVVVTAGGVVLQENSDYTVDYNLGRVKIINQGLLESQTPVKVSLESNSFFGVQQKTFIGNRLDYRVNKDLNLGATLITLSERPITQKVNFGDEPIRNVVFGFDGSYQTDAPFITRLINNLPLISTKEPSSITVNAEYAQLVPGNSKAIGNGGNSYIDDFEGSQSTIDLRSFNQWTLASTPQGQDVLFPEGQLSNDLSNGYRRARMAWHVIDPLFHRNSTLTPDNIDAEIQSNHLQRQILEQEVFPFRELRQGTPNNISIFDVAYYPSERGPYNYNPNLDPDGNLPNPRDSWGGITRRISTNDFESSNIEFIQFWIMDPFNEDSPNASGGKLYFNLGNVSEDVLRDSRKSFENGLPKIPNDPNAQVDETVWGRVPTKQSIVNAFDNTTNSNSAQDVGYDGLSDADEREFFANYLNSIQGALNPDAFVRIQSDPSNDNYHYYRGGDYDEQNLNIIDRYKLYNGVEANSPTESDSPENYPTSSTTLPSTEDVNLDNNLSESESYFQYEINLDPNDMVIGKNYITDIVEANPQLKNNDEKPVKWYQFKVPIRTPDAAVGGLQDFRSIRFMRMFMTDFQEPVFLRFARLELIRGEWRKYQLSLYDPNSGSPPPVGDRTLFDVGAVNIEENANKEPVNYVLPPDILREVDPSTTNLRQTNEQSLLLKACNLEDADARGTFKSAGFDARSYSKLEMYIHAEPGDLSFPLEYGDMSVFIRLGTDFDNNYYEYELPVTPTDVTGGGIRDPSVVWPSENNMVIDFSQLTRAKQNRNISGASFVMPYTEQSGEANITVKGNPVLNDVRTILIGIRNPAQSTNRWKNGDDGRPICAEVWVNELRLTDFINDGGYAATGRITAKLADLGNVAVAGNISTPGYGSVEKKVSERQRDTQKGFDVSTNLELGKFLPEESGIKIPMYYGYSEQIINPLYDPLSPDVVLDATTRNLTAEQKRDTLKRSQDYTRRKSINFTNIRKEKSPTSTKEERFYNIENFGFSYSYNEIYQRSIRIERKLGKNYRTSLTYGFQKRPKAFKPFENTEGFQKSNYLKILKDFNINLGPRQYGFTTSLDRQYTESLVRNNSSFALPPEPTVTKNFRWNRAYTFNYDITNALKFDFNANNNAVVQEPAGIIDKESDDYQAYKDTVLQNLKNFGETTNYNHSSSLSYRFPTKKFPLTDWTDISVNYTGTYDWQRAPFSQDTLGNTIQNSSTLNWTFQFNTKDLYKKFDYLKDLEAKKRKIERERRVQQSLAARNKNAAPTNPTDSTQTKNSKKKIEGLNLLESAVSLLTMVQTVSINYSKNAGTLLPGYSKNTNVLGFDNAFEGPGLSFLAGAQRGLFPFEAAEKGWLVPNENIYDAYVVTKAEKFGYRASLEPFNDLRIDLTANRTTTSSANSFFRFNEDINDWEDQSRVERLSYSTGVILISTAFTPDKKGTFQSDIITDYRNATIEVSRRLGEDAGTTVSDTTAYYNGFGAQSYEVIVPAFLAAYSGQDASKVSLDNTKQGLKPSWRINYDGLGKLNFFKQYFRSIVLGHGYQATYSTSYTSNLQALQNGERVKDDKGNFIPINQIGTITLSESFAPLFKIDMTWKNSLITSFEMKRSRAISLSLSNIQITEDKSNEYVIGGGYRFTKVKFPIKIKNKDVTSDLNVRMDLSIRKNLTLIRRLVEGFTDPTAGRTVISLKTSADYSVSRYVTLRAFFEKQITKPALSVPFPTANTNIGVSLRFTLSQ